jgi:hypothetical protein
MKTYRFLKDLKIEERELKGEYDWARETPYLLPFGYEK